MRALYVRELCRQFGVHLSSNGGDLHLESVLDPPAIPGALVKLCRATKAHLLQVLAYEQKADALLLESTHRLASAWPGENCPLDGPEWDAREEVVQAAYWSRDLDELAAALADRERYALGVFATHRNGVRNV